MGDEATALVLLPARAGGGMIPTIIFVLMAATPSSPFDARLVPATTPAAIWRLIFSVAVPFWLFIMATRVTMFLLTWTRNPLVIISPPSVRIVQHLLLLPVLLLCYRAALAIGWPRERRWIATLKHMGLGFVFAICARPFLVIPQAIHDDDLTLIRELWISELGPESLRSLWISSIFDFSLSYYFGLALLLAARTYAELEHEKLRTAQLQSDWMKARLQALRMRLNPHFLFNTLNSAVAVVRTQPHTAERMLIGLSELLRSVLRDGEPEQIPLRHEAEFVRKYLEIQRLRFPDRLTYDIEIPPETEGALVPALLLQPLAENAVIHGVSDEREAVRVRLRAHRDGERLVLEVENTSAPHRGPAPPGRKGSGIGLGTTRERLRAMFGTQQDVELAEETPGATIARVRIPFTLATAQGD